MPGPSPFAASVCAAIATMMSLSAARAQSAPAAAAATGDVVVDLQSADRSVRIDQLLVDGTSESVCTVPCRKALPRDGRYVIRADGLPGTSPFLLPDDRSDLTLVVNPGSRRGRITGITLALIGAAATFVGFTLAGGDPDPHAPPSPLRPWGLLIGLGGMAVGGIGAGIWLSNETRVWSSSGRSFATAAPPPARKRPAVAFTARGLEF